VRPCCWRFAGKFWCTDTRVGRQQRFRAPAPASNDPRSAPNATRTDVVGKIIYLRQHYHFGPARIAMYLKRYHNILKRLELNRLLAAQRHKRHDRRWKRFEKPLPATASAGCEVHPTASRHPKTKKYYQFTAIDDCTRLRVLCIYPKLTSRPPSSSWTTCWRGSRSGWRSSRPTTA
jgi:hypothetical protein